MVGVVEEWCWQGQGCHLVWPSLGVCVKGCCQGEDGWPCLLLPKGIFCSFYWGWFPPGPLIAAPFWGILCWETGVDAVEEVHCSCSRAPWKCWFMAMVMSWGGSVVSAREWVGTGVVVGAWMAVVMPSGCTWVRSTSRNHGSLKGSMWASASQRGSSGKALQRQYLLLELQQLAHLQLMQPAMGMGTGHAIHHGTDVPLIWYRCMSHGISQLHKRHMASPHLCPLVAQVFRPPLVECGSMLGYAHATVRPNTLSRWMVMLGASNKNAMSHLGFSMFPHASTWERLISCPCIIAHVWRVVTIGQKSCDPPCCFSCQVP